ncbi:MAG: LytTR family transcriptional regulator DNA-binding domain-containing protein [Pseudomonadota bacterium]
MAARPARPIVSWTITMGLGGLLLGYVGATDSYELPLLVRLSLWLGLCAVGGVIAVTIERAAVGSGLQSRSFLFWWILLTAGLAVAMIPVIFLVNSSGSYSQFANLPLFALNSFAISAALVAFRLLIGTLPVSKVPDEKAADDQSDQAWSAEQAPERPLLLGRLTAGLQSARLLALKSEGHYLKVFTDQGSELILMRLKDALAETGPVEGMQVHRSWWLARREGIERRNRDGRIELKLDEDNWVPVSRTHRSAWLKEDW